MSSLEAAFSGWWFGTYIGKSHDEIPQRMSGWWFMDGLWNHGMDYEFPIILGISSSQLLLTPSFVRGVG